MKSKKSSLLYRSKFLLDVFKEFVVPECTILEIGDGDGRNVEYLIKNGYPKVTGIDKLRGTAIEDVPETQYDVIFSMSTFFLIFPEKNWVFEKIARMAKRYIITIEGEETSPARFKSQVWGRNYEEIFAAYGFRQEYVQKDVFNKYGVLRVLKRI